MMAQQPVLVENTTITGLQLAMQPVSSIHVSLQAPPEPALKPDSVSIGLRAVSSGRSVVYWAQRANDGSFSFPAIDPGNYWLLTRTEDHRLNHRGWSLGPAWHGEHIAWRIADPQCSAFHPMRED